MRPRGVFVIRHWSSGRSIGELSRCGVVARLASSDRTAATGSHGALCVGIDHEVVDDGGRLLVAGNERRARVRGLERNQLTRPETGVATAPQGNRDVRCLRAADHRVGLGLVAPTYVPNGHVFYCPSFHSPVQGLFTYEDPLYGYSANFPTNEVLMTYEYARWVNKGWTPQTAKMQVLGRRAIVYDFFANGMGKYCHQNAYNVLYGDGSVKAFRDRGLGIMRRNIDMPAGLPDAVIVSGAFNDEQVIPAQWSK